MSASVPRLTIVASSATAKARLDRAAAAMLEQMPRELAERLARTCLVFALDGAQHAGFCQSLGGEEDPVSVLAEERARQRAPATEPLSLIVLNMRAYANVALLLGHELGHAALHSTHGVAAAALSPEELAAVEAEADAFAAKYEVRW